MMDANWRWLHGTGTDADCFSQFQEGISDCYLEGITREGYEGTYGVYPSGILGIRLNLFTRGNVGSRLYVLKNEQEYQAFHLLGQEISFTVDVSSLPCGSNAAVYLVEMPVTKPSQDSSAGPGLGLGYCDAQCPRDLKFVNGRRNKHGDYGACCAEIDLWEANSRAAAFTAHACKKEGLFACGGSSCSDICDRAGCDVNAYRLGRTSFYGRGSSFQIDTSRSFRVVTQFHTNNGSNLANITRFYLQDGKKIEEPAAISEESCAQRSRSFGQEDVLPHFGGFKSLEGALRRGLVLVLSVWDDLSTHMQWLDGTFPASGGKGSSRGPCSLGESETLRSVARGAHVVFTDFKYGSIGSSSVL